MFGVVGMEDFLSDLCKMIANEEDKTEIYFIEELKLWGSGKKWTGNKQKTHQVICESWKGKVQSTLEIKKKIIEKFRENMMRSPDLKTELCGIFNIYLFSLGFKVP